MNGWRIWGFACLVLAIFLVWNESWTVWLAWLLAYWGGVGIANGQDKGAAARLRRERFRREWGLDDQGKDPRFHPDHGEPS